MNTALYAAIARLTRETFSGLEKAALAYDHSESPAGCSLRLLANMIGAIAFASKLSPAEVCARALAMAGPEFDAATKRMEQLP